MLLKVTCLLFCGLTAMAQMYADTVVEFDISSAETPYMASPPWQLKGEAMEYSDGKLVQHLSPSSEEGITSYYISPDLGGLIGDGTRDYGIEFKVRPLGDIPYQGNSHYANLLIAWADAQKSYNLTIDASVRDAREDFLDGGLYGGGDQMVKIAEGIDWSKARTIFIGYDAKKQIFSLYVDGESVAEVPAESLTFDAVPEFFDRVAFGDTTSGQGNDISAEWYFVRVLTESKPSP